MQDPGHRHGSGGPRRLLITLAITFAAATVTAGVVLNQPHPQAAAAPAPHALKMLGRAHAELPQASMSDPSVPGALEALERSADGSREPTATF